MHAINSLSCYWSQPILKAYGWKNSGELFEYLRSVSEDTYSKKSFPEKAVFIQNVRRLIVSLELEGDAVKDAKQMTAPGSIMESLKSDYLFIRSRYLKKCKKLKEQLTSINTLLRGI